MLWGRIDSNAARMRLLVSGRAMSPRSPVIRATTRSTFPSTDGTGRPKAMEAMAPAVYSPMPGSDRMAS